MKTSYYCNPSSDCRVNTVYKDINPYTTVNNRQQTDAGSELQQATRLLSGRGRVLVEVGEGRHRREGFLQAKSQLGRSSYHVYLAFSGQSGQLDVRTGCLGRFICGQKTSSVNQAGRHGSTEHRTTVDKDVSVTVRVGDTFSTLPRPGAFNIFIGGQVGSNQVCMEA